MVHKTIMLGVIFFSAFMTQDSHSSCLAPKEQKGITILTPGVKRGIKVDNSSQDSISVGFIITCACCCRFESNHYRIIGVGKSSTIPVIGCVCQPKKVQDAIVAIGKYDNRANGFSENRHTQTAISDQVKLIIVKSLADIVVE